jgi:hypothetical protein
LRVEATAALGLEEGRRTVGRTGELRPTATAGAAGPLGAAPQANVREEEGVGHRVGLLARIHASWLGQPGRGARGVCAWPWARP